MISEEERRILEDLSDQTPDAEDTEEMEGSSNIDHHHHPGGGCGSDDEGGVSSPEKKKISFSLGDNKTSSSRSSDHHDEAVATLSTKSSSLKRAVSAGKTTATTTSSSSLKAGEEQQSPTTMTTPPSIYKATRTFNAQYRTNNNKPRRQQRRATMRERVSIFVNDCTSPQNLDESKASIIRDGIAFVFTIAVVVMYLLMRRGGLHNSSGDNPTHLKNYSSPLEIDFPIMLISVVLIIGTTRLSDATTIGERFLLTMVCSIILCVSTFGMFVVTSPCAHCVHMSAFEAVHSDSDIALLQTNMDVWKAWNIVLSPDENDDAHTVVCRRCISNIMTLFVFDGWVGYIKKRVGLSTEEDEGHRGGVGDDGGSGEEGRRSLKTRKKNYMGIQEMEIEHKSIHEDIGDLAAWYVHYANYTTTEDTKRFKRKVAEILEKQGHLAGHGIGEALKEYLCSPASRVDKPDPVKFLDDIRNSRFTGEDNLSNMSTATLQKIMRGDLLYELGVSVCFMLRFALRVPNDYTLEFKPVSHTHFAPTVTEKECKAMDITSHLPGVVMPQIDQDIDKDGRDILAFKKIMGIFTQFDYEDKPIYLDTKEEYIAFYRWELENSIQDDWFFPRWLLQGEKANAVADLLANRLKHSPDHLTLENPQADQTMSDRVFYGTGQKYLTPIKLPGIDEDYDYFFPLRGVNMLTNWHREQLKYSKKPSTKDLLKMIKNFHPKRVNDKSTLLEWKDKILQVDFAVAMTLPSREPQFYSPGCLLFVDAESRMPMGIWSSPRERMFLPHEGRDWVHAKYFWRVAERAALAGNHVAESHFGWSHAVSTAAWQTLPRTHAFRTLLKPFTLNVHSVNSAAYNMLVRDHSVLTHGAGVVTQGVNHLFHMMYSCLNFSQSVPEALDAHGLDDIIDTSDMPLFSQGRRLYEVHRQFVENFVSVIYKSDEEMLKDDSLIRFWHHVNTYGRHLDPCVCAMSSDVFFDDDGEWPQNEDTRTCEELMDLAEYMPGKNVITRRRQWCTRLEPFDRIKAVRRLLEKNCKERNPDCRLLYGLHFMRENMDMKPLTTRTQLVNFIATFIWEVTAGHQFNGDNISYFADPEHSGVRMREFDNNGELPITTDLGTYVFGTSIASLTTVRSAPLLADWSPLYSFYASTRTELTSKERNALLQKLNDIHLTYKHALFDLSTEFLQESISRPTNQRSNVFIPAVQTSSVSV